MDRNSTAYCDETKTTDDGTCGSAGRVVGKDLWEDCAWSMDES